MQNLEKKYRIYLYENINGLGILGDQGYLFDTWQEAYDKKIQLQKDGTGGTIQDLDDKSQDLSFD